MNTRNLKKYAKTIVKIGANIKRGQDVVIISEINNVDLVRYIVEECYKAHARKVSVEWNDDQIAKLHYLNQDLETLKELPEWSVKKLEYRSKTLPAMIYIESSDPDALKGVDQNKIRQAKMAQYPTLKPYKDAMDNKYQWTIVAAASPAWAKKVFPNDKEKVAVNKLWDAILKAARIDGKNPIQDWKKHNEDLAKRCAFLNNLDIDYLHYKASNGTDFTLKVKPGTIFLGGGETTIQGRYFNPNIPTEECFGMPDPYGVNGKVVASKPLSYNGELIENFSFKFVDGKVVEAHAEKNEELLKHMISMDEGASRLGEVALVPYNSPISQSNILFYNTLFDENASCHLALGRAFSNNILGYEKMSLDDIKNFKMNDSMIHVDFMIGTKDLEIVAVCKDKTQVQIFKNGNWAF